MSACARICRILGNYFVIYDENSVSIVCVSACMHSLNADVSNLGHFVCLCPSAISVSFSGLHSAQRNTAVVNADSL